MLPPRPFLDSLVLRVLVMWLFLRGVSYGGSAAMGIPYPQSPIGSPTGTVFLTVVIIFMVRVEMWRRSETLFLANLGYSFRGIALAAFCECVVLEAGLRVAVVVAGSAAGAANRK
ncbi:MAG TPA: hypothetical protein EYQ64_06545 [Gemmatimonadetes bacterium]|nr:hypothetical protein [Gemmatimonadota bacterium]